MIRGLPERLKENRKRYGYSQKQVAAKLGLSPSIVSGYETGERTPSTEVLLSLSYLYHCSLDYLVGKQTQEQPCVLGYKRVDRQTNCCTQSVDCCF